MLKYLLKRLGQAVVVVFLVTIVTFALLQSQPGGAARAALGKDATQEQLDGWQLVARRTIDSSLELADMLEAA